MKYRKARNKKEELAGRNKKAFDEILGDPYGYEGPLPGLYNTLKSKSLVGIVQYEQSSPSAVNNAKPGTIDFFCDVDSAIEDGLLKAYPNVPLEYPLAAFISTYINEDDIYTMTQNERAVVEQAIGRLLVARKISPSALYFTTIKGKK